MAILHEHLSRAPCNCQIVSNPAHHALDAAPLAEPALHLCLQAINTLRTLSEQIYLMQCSSSSQAEGVAVEVTSGYLGVSSGPGGLRGLAYMLITPLELPLTLPWKLQGWVAGWLGRCASPVPHKPQQRVL